MKDIRNKNSKGQFHGYQELYIVDNLYYRFNANNAMEDGYEEGYNFNNKIGLLRFYIV